MSAGLLLWCGLNDVWFEFAMPQHVDPFAESVLVKQVAQQDNQPRARSSVDKSLDDARQIRGLTGDLQFFQKS